MGDGERALGRCDTQDCYRDAVVTFDHSDPENVSGSVQFDLCLPCRRVIEHARGIPWGSQSEQWRDAESLQDFRAVRPVSFRRTDHTGGGRASE